MAPRAHIYLDDAPLGAYVAQVRVTEMETPLRETMAEVEIELDELYSMRLHIDNAIQSLEERKLIDAICGTCEQCSNTRMIHEIRHGHDWTEHCPVCQPKIDAVRAAFKNGLAKPNG